MINGNDFPEHLNHLSTQIEDYIDNVFPIEASVITEHFIEDNFLQEGFLNNGLQPWEDVKRRDSNSPWYGFAPKNKNQFSQTRASDPILKDTNALFEATTIRQGKGEIIVTNDRPYAEIHNEGGTAYIFGKKPFQMPKRQFIGHSKELNEAIIECLENGINRIIK